VLGAAFGALAYVAVRAATARASVNLIVLYFTAVSTLCSLPLAIPEFVTPSPRLWIPLAGVGISSTLAQVAMTQGYRFAPAPLASTMSLMNAAMTAFFGLVFFHEILLPLQWLGVGILGTAVWVISFGASRRTAL
jgi:drug/metabolite transporter (DMT)-like permease